MTAGAPGASSGVVKAVDGIARGAVVPGLRAGRRRGVRAAAPVARGARRARAGGGSSRCRVGALMLGSVVLLLLQGPYTTGGGLLDAFKPSLLSFSLSTDFGLALLARIVLTLGVHVARRPRPDGRSAVSALGRVRARPAADVDADRPLAHGRPAVAGRPGGDRAPARDGAVVRRARAAARSCSTPSLRAALPRFSRLALGCFVALGVTGVYLAWRQAGELAALPATEFGRLLLIKSGIVLVIVGLACVLAPGGRRGAARGRCWPRSVLGVGRAGRDGGAGERRARARELLQADRRQGQGRARRDRRRSRSTRPSRARTSPTSIWSSPTGGSSSRRSSRCGCARATRACPSS